MSVRNCMYSHVGCQFKGADDVIQTHEGDKSFHHTAILLYCDKQKIEIENLKLDLVKSKAQIQILEDEVLTWKIECEQLKEKNEFLKTTSQSLTAENKSDHANATSCDNTLAAINEPKENESTEDLLAAQAPLDNTVCQATGMRKVTDEEVSNIQNELSARIEEVVEMVNLVKDTECREFQLQLENIGKIQKEHSVHIEEVAESVNLQDRGLQQQLIDLQQKHAGELKEMSDKQDGIFTKKLELVKEKMELMQEEQLKEWSEDFEKEKVKWIEDFAKEKVKWSETFEKEKVKLIEILNEYKTEVEKNQCLRIHELKSEVEQKQILDGGDLIWKVEYFSQVTSLMSVNGIYSQSFYSKLHRYRLCLHLMSFYRGFKICLCLIEGKNDDQLKWPLICTHIITLLDQRKEIDVFQNKFVSRLERPNVFPRYSLTNSTSFIISPTRLKDYLEKDSIQVKVTIHECE